MTRPQTPRFTSLQTAAPCLALAAALLLSAAPTATAQGCVYLPDADPTTGAGSINPFGAADPNDPNTANQALAFRIPLSALPAQPVRIAALGFASEGDRTRHFASFTVRLGQNPNPGLNPLIPLNMVGFTAVVAGGSTWEWNTPANQWSFIGLTSTYPFDPQNGDLVVEVVVAGATSTGTGPLGFRSDPAAPSVLQTAWRFQPGRGVVGTGAPKIRVCWDATDLETYGGGCAGSNGKIPQMTFGGSSALGQSLTIGLRDVPATSPGAILILDPRLRAMVIDLTPIGAPGCTARTFFTYFQPLPLVGGSIDVPATVPNNPAFVGGVIWAQWFPLDAAANNLGLTASTLGRILIGT